MYNLGIQLAVRIDLPPYIGGYIKCSCGVESEQDRNTIISIRKRTSEMWYLPPTGRTQSVATQITTYVSSRRAYHVPLPLPELAPNERPCEHDSRELASYVVPVPYVILFFLLGGDWRLWPCRDSCPGKGINGPLESNSIATHIADQID